MAEAIDPRWTKGTSFVLAFVIEGSPAATIYVSVRDGAPIVVTRVRGDQPQTVVKLSERSFLRMMAGASVPVAEEVLIEGDEHDLQTLIGWADRAQGLISNA